MNLSSEKQSNDRLVGNYGSFMIMGSVTPTIDFCTLVGGQDGAEITTIRVQDLHTGKIYEYTDKAGNFTWDGVSLGTGEILEFPVGFRLYSIVLASGSVKGILMKQTNLKEVV
jgi:hypothetical protein